VLESAGELLTTRLKAEGARRRAPRLGKKSTDSTN